MPHKLLLADDSVTIQRVIELTFADEDITVIAVGDGRQAIERVRTERPDIVLADVGMPERDGYEVAAFVKGTPEFAHIPVLLLTGAFEPIEEGRAQAAGCDGVLVKPFEPQMVISRVKDLIAGRKPVQKMPAQTIPVPSTDTVRAPVTASPAASAAAAPTTGSVDEYFDRLDAAFASLESQPAARMDPVEPRQAPDSPGAPGAGLAYELAHWDPAQDVQAPSGEAAATSPATQSESAAAARLPTLAEAFAALLSAETNRTITPSAVSGRGVDDDLVEQVTRRVIERLGDSMVRGTVIEVAERLVAEEIARFKAAAR